LRSGVQGESAAGQEADGIVKQAKRPEDSMTTKTIEQELLEMEKQYWQAIKDKDAPTAARLTDARCIVTGAQGVRHIEKATLPEAIKAAPYTLDDFKMDDDVEVRMLGDDVAILAYKVHERLTVEGKPVTLEAADSSTWVRRDGRWVCALHTEAIVGDPFGRDRRQAER
jgi:hypothetical protein